MKKIILATMVVLLELILTTAKAVELATTPDDDLASSITLWNVDRNKLEDALARGANPNIWICLGVKSYASTNKSCSQYNEYESPLWAIATSNINEDQKPDLIRHLTSKGATTEKRRINAKDGKEEGGLGDLLDKGLSLKLLGGVWSPNEKRTDRATTIKALIDAGYKIEDWELQKEFRYHSHLKHIDQLDMLQQVATILGKEQVLNAALAQETKKKEDAEKQAAILREQGAKEEAIKHKYALEQVKQVGQKICRIYSGTTFQTVSYGSTTARVNEKNRTFKISGFTENTSKNKLQIRIGGIMAFEGSAPVGNIDKLEGDIILQNGSVIWDDAGNWNPC